MVFFLELTSNLRLLIVWKACIKVVQLGPVALGVVLYNFDDMMTLAKARGAEEYKEHGKIIPYD